MPSPRGHSRHSPDRSALHAAPGQDRGVTTRDPDPLDEDDDALQWAGDDVTGRDAPRLGGDATQLETVEGAPPERARRSAGDVGLAALTVLFGIAYLGVTLGWILSVQQLGYPALDLPGEVMWQFGEFLSLVAAVLWFAAVLALTPDDTHLRAVKRAGWLALGLAVLAPWPYLLGALG